MAFYLFFGFFFFGVAFFNGYFGFLVVFFLGGRGGKEIVGH
jgi:hypothetical protein